MEETPFITVNIFMKSKSQYSAVVWRDSAEELIALFEQVYPLAAAKKRITAVDGSTLSIDLRDVECVLTSSSDDYEDYYEFLEDYHDE